jgi:hypothetical protein
VRAARAAFPRSPPSWAAPHRGTRARRALHFVDVAQRGGVLWPRPAGGATPATPAVSPRASPRQRPPSVGAAGSMRSLTGYLLLVGAAHAGGAALSGTRARRVPFLRGRRPAGRRPIVASARGARYTCWLDAIPDVLRLTRRRCPLGQCCPQRHVRAARAASTRCARRTLLSRGRRPAGRRPIAAPARGACCTLWTSPSGAASCGLAQRGASVERRRPGWAAPRRPRPRSLRGRHRDSDRPAWAPLARCDP